MMNAYLYEGLRTPFGRHAGTLAKVRPDDLLADAVKNLMKKSAFKAEQFEDFIVGCANQSGEDSRCVARHAGLVAGLPSSELEVTAVDELQLLSISTEAFGPTGSARPQVALRFYRGLCKVLALRLMGLHRHSPADPALAGFGTHPAERRNERLLRAQAGLVEQGLELGAHRAHRGAPHQGDAPGRQPLTEQV